MSAPVIAFFNTQSGVGKTTLVQHLAWMYEELGLRVLAVDLDPQAYLTSVLLNDDRLYNLWPEGAHPNTIFGPIESFLQQPNDRVNPHTEYASEDQLSTTNEPTRLALLPGDLSLARIENTFAEAWGQCLHENNNICRLMFIFWNVIQSAASDHMADIVLMDLGSNLGGINRAGLIAADYVVFPLAGGMLSSQGLQFSGITLRSWKEGLQTILTRNPLPDQELPAGRIEPLGYVYIQPQLRLDRPVRVIKDFPFLYPRVYRESILNEPGAERIAIADDPHCLALLKDYQTVMPIAREAHKPIFQLKPADGAMGSELQVVQSAYREFKQLAEKIAERTNVTIPRLY
jgi:cellulose biosynthesis protein BcsQ